MSAIQDILEILEGNQFCDDDFNLLDLAVKMKKSGLPGQKVSPELLALHRKCRVARNNGETMVCPKCGGVEIVKNGKKDGRQRYLCKGCRKTFGDTFGTIFYHSKLDLSRKIPAGKHVHNGFSLARVNSFHSRLASFQEPLKQVGSRHLDNYLALFRWTDLMRNEQTGEKLSMVLEMMTKKAKLLKRDNLSHRPFPFDTKGMAVPA